jgi:hypothetical protein
MTLRWLFPNSLMVYQNYYNGWFLLKSSIVDVHVMLNDQPSPAGC